LQFLQDGASLLNINDMGLSQLRHFIFKSGDSYVDADLLPPYTLSQEFKR
jgi:hypothetical protein